MPETCRVLSQNKFWIFDASSWLFYVKKNQLSFLNVLWVSAFEESRKKVSLYKEHYIVEHVY